MRKMVRGVRMVHQDLLRRHPLDPVAERILDCMRGRISYKMIAYEHNILKKGVRSRIDNSGNRNKVRV